MRRSQGRAAVAGLTGVILMAGVSTGCSAIESVTSPDPSFDVGDCVRIEEGALDSDLTEAACDEAVGTFDPAARTYRVDSVIEGPDGSCPEGRGFFPVQFTHEPDDVIYCLVQYDRSEAGG